MMTQILSIETSTRVCSVAIHQDGVLAAQSSLYLEKSHSTRLGTMVNELIASCELGMQDLSAVAISGGPGSYTGLRIGCSLAKGICYALEIPLISVPTLEALARQVRPYVRGNPVLCPMLDARRMEVYMMLLDAEGGILEDIHAHVLDERSLSERVAQGEVWLFGNGAGKAAEIIDHPNVRYIPGLTTEARSVGEIAHEKFGRSEFENVAYYEPFYLKEFQATKPKKKL